MGLWGGNIKTGILSAGQGSGIIRAAIPAGYVIRHIVTVGRKVVGALQIWIVTRIRFPPSFASGVTNS